MSRWNATTYLDLAWCEAPGAALGPVHLRSLTRDERLLPSGNLTGPALCGVNLTFGWDVRQARSADLTPLPGIFHEWRCPDCLKALAGTDPDD